MVAVLNERGDSARFTGLCGCCFFRDPTMADEDQWNQPAEATE